MKGMLKGPLVLAALLVVGRVAAEQLGAPDSINYHWPQSRFSVAQGGVVGPGVGPVRAFVLVPLAAAALWILASLAIGGGLGSIAIAMKRKSAVKVAV